MATLSLSAATFVRRDPDAIFRELQDPQTLVRFVPGATLTRVTGRGAFEAVMSVAIGPLRSEYRGHARIVAADPRNRTASLELRGDPSTNPAPLRVHMSMAIAERHGGSQIRMSFQVALSGRNRALAGPWLDPIACDLIDRSTHRMKQLLEEAPVVPFPPAA